MRTMDPCRGGGVVAPSRPTASRILLQCCRWARRDARPLSRAILTISVVAGAVTLIPTTANAAFPGADGVIVYVSNGGSSDRSCSQDDRQGESQGDQLQDQLFVLQVGASQPYQLTCTSGRVQHPFVSPDGLIVVFSSTRDGDVSQLFTIALSTAGPHHHATPTLVSGTPGASDDYPSWSPANDGTIVFQRTISGGLPQLYSENVADPSTAAPLFASPTGFSDTEPVFDPSNANVVAFVRNTGGHSHIFSYNLSTHVLTDLSAQGNGGGAGNDSKPDFAPAGPGERIAFQSDRACGSWQLYTMTAQGTGQVPVFGSGGSSTCSSESDDPVYSPQGDALAFDRRAVSPQDEAHAPASHKSGNSDNSQSNDSQNSGNDNEGLYTVSIDASGVATGSATPLVRDEDDSSGTGDQPNWGPAAPATQTPEVPLPIVLPLAGAGAAGAALAIRRRRARRALVSA
jgi:Tol biopolymer transport system component